jgi:hypothetical protein
MIPPAPVDFWMQVVARVATLVFERETALSAGVRLQGTGPVPMMTDSERARDMERRGRPGTMPTPAPPEAAE